MTGGGMWSIGYCFIAMISHVLLLGLEALEVAEYDLLLLDIRMPRLNGIEVIRRIRKDEKLKSLPVVAVTASDDRKRLQRLSSQAVPHLGTDAGSQETPRSGVGNPGWPG